MKFFKQAYRVIGCVIIILGLLLTPILPLLIKNPPSFINIYLIFGLYLAQSVSSYLFFAYKRTIIQANQQIYIINTIDWWFTLGVNTAQMVVLWLFRSFELFVGLEIFANITKNILISRISDKMFPYINKKSDNKLTWQETKNIMKDCYALALWKVNTVIISSIDSICLASIVGLESVSLYSNFQVLRNNIGKLLNIFYISITASLGNLNAIEGKRNFEIFKISNLITVILYGIFCLGFFFVANPFVSIWIGSEFEITTLAVLLLGIDMYISGINKLNDTFRSALGLFQYMKYIPLLGASVNIAVSIWLAHLMGMSGVIIGTIMCNFAVYFWLEPMIIFKNSFKEKLFPYYIINLGYAGLVVVIGVAIYFFMKYLNLKIWWYVLVSGSLSVFLPIIVFALVFWKTKEMTYIRQKLLTIRFIKAK